MNTPLLMFNEKGITTLTLNRPDKCNALNSELIDALVRQIEYCEKDPKTQVLIINGMGKHFCAGADIQSLKTGIDAKQWIQLFSSLFTFSKPTIASLKGSIMGGGIGLAACCDIVIAAENAVFGFSEIKLGLTPSMISPYIISAIGAKAARYYFLTAELFDVHTAVQLGLVHQIAALDLLENAIQSTAEKISQYSPHALIEAKKLIHHVDNTVYSEALCQWTAEHFMKIGQSEDAKKRVLIFFVN